MWDEVCADTDVGGGAGQGLLVKDLDADLFDAFEEVAQSSLFGQEQLQQADLELEVVVISGDDLDAARRRVEELAIGLRRGAERFLDQDDVAEVVPERKGGEVSGCGRGDIGDDV